MCYNTITRKGSPFQLTLFAVLKVWKKVAAKASTILFAVNLEKEATSKELTVFAS